MFDVSSEDGALTASDGAPPEIRGLVEPLTPDEPTWKVPYSFGKRLEPDRERD